jgi:Putative Flp pilus-assembly TadE/G-like
MTTLLTRLRDESGQAFVFIAAILTALVGMTALVVDVGSWYQADRRLQTAADAAALAGAQELPLDQGGARDTALRYAQHNYAGIPAPTVTFPDAGTIDVVARAETRGIFAPVLSEAFEFVTVRAEAQAKVLAPQKLKDVAPIAVHKDEACIVSDPSCFGQTVILEFAEDDPYDSTKSKFGLLDLDRDGSAGAGDMKDWLENGYDDFLPIDTTYPPANGEKNGIKKELQQAADDERVLLFPIYDTATAAGYHVIGWAAFVIDDIGKWAGKEHVLTGHFVTFIATSLAGGNTLPSPEDDFGVHVITLTK